MNADCRSFRRTLEEALAAARGAERTSLAWHEHLLGCGDCRALLESEEALETLLESLPEPRLPPQLARRVLARLRRGEAALDRLLELDAAESAPRDLARRVLAGLQGARGESADLRLDALLERARALEVPEQLSQRVLAHVAEERQLGRKRRPILARRSAWIAAAAGVLLLAAWALWPRPAPEREMAQVPEPADPRLLENMELLQHWELLRRNDLDTLLSTLPLSDQVLIEMGSEEGLLGG